MPILSQKVKSSLVCVFLLGPVLYPTQFFAHEQYE